jgi:hypothetical protein
MTTFRLLPCLFGILAVAMVPDAIAESTVTARAPAVVPVSLRPPSAKPAPGLLKPDTGPLVLSAPPRDTEEEGHKIFDPIATFMSSVLGRPVVYRHPTTWGGYQADMQRGAYDIVFDGPHFNGWRAAHQQHRVLVKIPGEFVYTAVVRPDSRVTGLKSLAGRKICAHAPPNLGTLIMYSEFDNPARQPLVMVEEGYHQIYEKLQAGRCEAAMLPLSYLRKYDPDQAHTRVIFRTAAMPQQAFSAGPRLTQGEQDRLASALLAPDAAAPLADFNQTYALNRGLVPAATGEYASLAVYLKDQWGY